MNAHLFFIQWSIFIGMFFFLTQVQGQDPNRFSSEIAQLMLQNNPTEKNGIVLFTGSSSIRFWSGLHEDFPGLNIVNNGFGGSQMSDLIHFRDSLIFKFWPIKVFIYEGDNDIQFGKSPDHIMEEVKLLAEDIRIRLPKTEIFFISAKPSIARWSLRENYQRFNKMLQSWSRGKEGIEFIDVWSPMCDQDGNVLKNIFIADNLHMNAEGYAIWKQVISPYLRDR